MKVIVIGVDVDGKIIDSESLTTSKKVYDETLKDYSVLVKLGPSKKQVIVIADNPFDYGDIIEDLSVGA